MHLALGWQHMQVVVEDPAMPAIFSYKHRKTALSLYLLFSSTLSKYKFKIKK